MRGTFGFVRHEMYGKQCLTRAVVDHVFGDGRLLALLMINSNTPGEVISPEDFAPSREAYVSFGSYVEPQVGSRFVPLYERLGRGKYQHASDTKPTGEHQDRR